MAARLRAETTMTVRWVAERLTMGTRGYLNHLLYRRRKLGGESPISSTDPFTLPFTPRLTSQPRRHAFPRAGLRCALGIAITAAMAGITKLGLLITHGG